MQKLSKDEIDVHMDQVKNWKLKDEVIKRSWKFKDFKAAIVFINKVAELAEEHDHHPIILNVYNRVELRFFTHVVNGLTEKDFKIAEEIDSIV
jgi:4a-hydroxytetrahydrobiopterin dehydratase